MSNNIDELSAIVSQIVKDTGMAEKDISAKLGYSERYITEAKARGYISDKFMAKLRRANFKDEVEYNVNSIIHAPKGRIARQIKGNVPIPYYDIDFAAGDIEFYDDSNSITPAYMMDIPEFSGCTAFRTYGDSMEKTINSGAILFGRRIEDWKDHLEYGQIYGIVCTDKRKYLKYIRKAEDPVKHFLLKSENKSFDDFDLPKLKVKSIWLIHGWINKKA